MWPASWQLWAQPPLVIAFALLIDAAALGAGVVVLAGGDPPSGTDWNRFALLAGCAAVHVYSSRRNEELRRRFRPSPYVDLTAIWTVGAVLALPLPLALATIVSVRVMRWMVTRRQLHRTVFTTAATAIAAMTASGCVHAAGVTVVTDLDWPGALGQLAGLLLAGLAYQVVQAALIAGMLCLVNTAPTWANVLGTRTDNELESATIALGVVTAIVLVHNPVATPIMLLVSVVGSRLARLRQLESDVRTDPKTGLLNMRGWREAADRELARTIRNGGTLGLLMVDLDHFKQVNDTWGHPAGDDVLNRLASALRDHTRPTDVVGRFGGEEFVVLLPDVHGGEAFAAAQRIRGEVTRLAVPSTDKRGVPVVISGRTTSVGVAMYPYDARSVDALLQAADAAVYAAKEGGRDQVWPPSHPTGATFGVPGADR